MALLTLSQLYLQQDEYDLAKTVLIQALAEPAVGSGRPGKSAVPVGPGLSGWQVRRSGRGDLAFHPGAVGAAAVVRNLQQSRPGLSRTWPTRRCWPGNRRFDQGVQSGPASVRSVFKTGPRRMRSAVIPETWTERSGTWNGQSTPGLRGPAFLQTVPPFTWNGAMMATLTGPSKTWIGRWRSILIWQRLGSTEVTRGWRGATTGMSTRAVADFTKAIELAADSAAGYYNRALVRSESQEWELSNADLLAAQERDPRNPAINGTVCWQLASAASPRRSLAILQPGFGKGTGRPGAGQSRACVCRDGQDLTRPSRISVCFWTGSRLRPSQRVLPTTRPSRESWIRALQSGDDPFDDEALRELRLRPVSPGGAPC